jgi:NAD(P)-dependent dehydrogenase (short-subunit alcohol dehydrogenase family)
MQNAANVKDPRILISGGASGIGVASVKVLASRGAHVINNADIDHKPAPVPNMACA